MSDGFKNLHADKLDHYKYICFLDQVNKFWAKLIYFLSGGGGGGEDVNLVFKLRFLANQHRAFYMQRLANSMRIKCWGVRF